MKPLNSNFIILEICQKQPLDIIAMTPRGTLPFTHYRFPCSYLTSPLGTLQRVTKSEKVHISRHDELQKLHNINFAWHRS